MGMMVFAACLVIHGCSQVERETRGTPCVPMTTSVATEEPNQAACRDKADKASLTFFRWSEQEHKCMVFDYCVFPPSKQAATRTWGDLNNAHWVTKGKIWSTVKTGAKNLGKYVFKTVKEAGKEAF